jgi:tRNA pseudouridine55 synthase
MHSAKKKGGKALYELAREGIEIEREPVRCQLHSFEILSYEAPRARFRVVCSSGTYIRTLSQDLARLLGTVGMLDELRRTNSGRFAISRAMSTEAICASDANWDELPCFVPFHFMLDGAFDRVVATGEEERAIIEGRQGVLFSILKRVEPCGASEPTSRVAIYTSRGTLLAVACSEGAGWRLERVFT